MDKIINEVFKIQEDLTELKKNKLNDKENIDQIQSSSYNIIVNNKFNILVNSSRHKKKLKCVW
jgi:hypothetical protein